MAKSCAYCTAPTGASIAGTIVGIWVEQPVCCSCVDRNVAVGLLVPAESGNRWYRVHATLPSDYAGHVGDLLERVKFA